ALPYAGRARLFRRRCASKPGSADDPAVERDHGARAVADRRLARPVACGDPRRADARHLPGKGGGHRPPRRPGGDPRDRGARRPPAAGPVAAAAALLILAFAALPRDNPRRSQREKPMSLPQKPAPRVFSGMQPTGNLHLGNYLGAMVRWVEMQKSHECIYCVVDMHAITLWQDPRELKAAIRSVTAAYMAAGLDPKKSSLFNQSQVHEHAELAWVFNCVARLGWLNRVTQFKEKAGKDRENASVGLYAYPVLMAADILAYRATYVPVGEDQKQHLEL